MSEIQQTTLLPFENYHKLARLWTSVRVLCTLMNDSENKAVDILNEYESQKELFEELKNTCKYIVKALLGLKNIQVHSVDGRVKDRKKLAEKLAKKGKNYECLADVTDI